MDRMEPFALVLLGLLVIGAALAVGWLLAQQAVDLMHLPMPAVKCTEGKVPRYYFFHLQ